MVKDITRQELCNRICHALQATRAAGEGNALVELRYIPELQIVRPVFENGTGEDGYYDICVEGDSGIGIFSDICKQFVNRMW